LAFAGIAGLKRLNVVFDAIHYADATAVFSVLLVLQAFDPRTFSQPAVLQSSAEGKMPTLLR